MTQLRQSSRRKRRANFQRDIKVFLGSDVILTGKTKDISFQSVSFFLSLKGSSQYFLKKGWRKGEKIPLKLIKAALFEELILISFDDEHLSEPIDLKITRVETSWQKSYDLFVAGIFQTANANEFFVKDLGNLCPELKESPSRHEKYLSEKLPFFKQKLIEEKASYLHLEFSNSYHHVQSIRDLTASLADKYGFLEEEVYQIKLISDELLMNAFLYGTSDLMEQDKSILNLYFGQSGMIFEITDHGGKYFNDHPYHFRKGLSLEQLGGLALVEAYSDDWQVEIDPGKSTKVTYFKTLNI